MKLIELVDQRAIVPELASSDRNGAIRELVDSLVLAERLAASQAESISKSIIARERNRGTTGFGKGAAVPHVKLDGLPRCYAALGRSTVGIDFSSLDGKPVHAVFLILSPSERPNEHIQAMDLVFKRLHSDWFRKFLRQSDTVEKLYDLLKEADEKALV